jgi:glycosidase
MAVCAIAMTAQCFAQTKLSPLVPKHEVLYEINVRQFSEEGKFSAIIPQLPRIKAMGVTTIWLMPIYPIGVEARKGKLGSYYSVKNYTDVNPEFGTTDDFKALVNAAHASGLRVILDWVANHTAWDHKWVKDHPEYYERDKKTGKLASPFDWTDVVELNYNNNEMRAAMIENMRWWVSNFGVDGFRCDVAEMVPVDFWEKARESIDAKHEQLWLGESENDQYFSAFDLQYAWKYMHMLEDYAKGKLNQDSAQQIMNRYQMLASKGLHHMFFTSNHDENSWNGTDAEKFDDAHRALIEFTVAMPGAFMIYNGQESGLDKRLKFFEKDPIVWNRSDLPQYYTALLQDRAYNLSGEHSISYLPTTAAGDLAMLVNTSNGTNALYYYRRTALKNGAKGESEESEQQFPKFGGNARIPIMDLLSKKAIKVGVVNKLSYQ